MPFGVQKVLPACPTLFIAQPSVEITPPIALKRVRLNVAPTPMISGNEVCAQ